MRITTDMKFKEEQAPFVAACHSLVLVFRPDGMDNFLDVYNVSAEHSVSYAGREYLTTWMELACTRIGKDTYVAVSHRFPLAVVLYRIEWASKSLGIRKTVFSISLSYVNEYSLNRPGCLLFRGDLLLVADRNLNTDTDSIVSFRVSDGKLTEMRELLAVADADKNKNGIKVLVWTLVGHRLILWDERSSGLIIYGFA